MFEDGKSDPRLRDRETSDVTLDAVYIFLLSLPLSGFRGGRL